MGTHRQCRRHLPGVIPSAVVWVVAICIGRLGRVQRERIVGIQNAVVVVIGIGVITSAVTICIGRLGRVQRERIVSIQDTVVVIIRVGIVPNAVGVRIGGLGRV